MGKHQRLLVAVLFCCFGYSYAQESPDNKAIENARLLYWNTKFTDSGKYIIYHYQSSCKGIFSASTFFPNEPVVIKQEKISYTSPPPDTKAKFLTLHGNVSYEYYYRSELADAINPAALQQHTEKVFLNLTLKEKYPFKIAFTARQSNSPFFKNFLDPNIQFDPTVYSKNIRQQAINKVGAQLTQTPEMKSLRSALDEQKERYNKLKNKVESASTMQKVIEERERAYMKKQDSINSSKITGQQINAVAGKVNVTNEAADTTTANENESKHDRMLSKRVKVTDSINSIKTGIEAGKDSISSRGKMLIDTLKNKTIDKLGNKKDSLYAKVHLLKDSTERKYSDRYQNDKKRLDSMSAKIDSLQKRYDSLKNDGQKEFLAQKQRLYNATNQKEIEKVAAENGVRIDSSTKLEKVLSGVKQFSIGKSMLNYTELTAQNINITGVNVEYNPSWYAAIAAGKIEYRFRDFINQKKVHNTQYIVMGRVGLGNVRKRAIIFSVFKGRKDQSGYAIPDSLQNHINILGYALEGLWRKDENTYFSAEAAKTTLPYVKVDHSGKANNVLWKFSDMSNFGINLKAGFHIHKTNTNLSGFFRKTGENFQSFSLFSYNTNQSAWLARVDQTFLKSHIGVTAMLRQNDFTNPFTDKTFKTTTTFKTFMLNVRFPKYPSVSLGYYPGTQLYIVNKETIRENAYYIMNASVTYGYNFHKTAMSSSFILYRYFNQATDSGFIQYKGVTYYATQSVFMKRLQLQGGWAYSKQPELKYYTLESSADYETGKYFKIGVGVKCNRVLDGNDYLGGRVQLAVNLKGLGVLQIQYDKSYLPASNETLLPIESGRATWIKSF